MVRIKKNPSTLGLYRRRRRALLERLGGRCERCGSEDLDRLQFHHVENGHDTHGQGGWNALIRVEREVEEGVRIELLCKECHELLHAQEPGHPLRNWVGVGK